MNAGQSLDSRAHFHVGWNRLGCLPDGEPESCDTFGEAKTNLIAELLAASDSVGSWCEPHDCDDVPCPTFGDECPNDIANSLALAAEDLNLTSGPEWSDVVAGFVYWIMPCSDEDCDVEGDDQ